MKVWGDVRVRVWGPVASRFVKSDLRVRRYYRPGARFFTALHRQPVGRYEYVSLCRTGAIVFNHAPIDSSNGEAMNMSMLSLRSLALTKWHRF